MTISNKILTKPSGRGIGQQMGGGTEFFPLTGSVAFFRDDFNTSALDVNEWDTTSAPQTGTGSIYVSAGIAVVDLGTSSTATATITSRDKYRIPFRVTYAVGIDGYNTGMEAFLRIRDTGGTFLAEWLLTDTAGGTKATASTRVRAGSTAAGMIGSAAVEPSAVTGLDASAALMYVIDADYSGISFAMATAGGTTSVFTTIPQVPSVRTHFPSPVLKANVPYVVEVHARSGTAAGAATNSADNASAFLMLDFVEVRQYVPDAVFHTQSNVMQVYAATTGTGATAMIGLTQLKWG